MRVVRASDQSGSSQGSDGDIKTKSRRRIKLLLLLPIFIVLAFIAVSFNTDFIPSSSMEPTLRPGDHIVTMRAWAAYPFGKMPERGDVITFHLTDPAQIQALNDAGEDQGQDENNGGNPSTDSGKKQPPLVLIKRVIGLPGDRVQLREDGIYVNDHKLIEHYQTLATDEASEMFSPYAVNQPFEVPAEHLFVMGDNRTNSDDGRYWGALKRSDVLGKYVYTLFHRNQPDEKNGE